MLVNYIYWTNKIFCTEFNFLTIIIHATAGTLQPQAGTPSWINGRVEGVTGNLESQQNLEMPIRLFKLPKLEESKCRQARRAGDRQHCCPAAARLGPLSESG